MPHINLHFLFVYEELGTLVSIIHLNSERQLLIILRIYITTYVTCFDVNMYVKLEINSVFWSDNLTYNTKIKF